MEPILGTPKQKFLRYCPNGFSDPVFLKYERDFKWAAHNEWHELLNPAEFSRLIAAGQHSEIARRARKVDSTTIFMLSWVEKAALNDATKGADAVERFSRGLFDLIYGEGECTDRLEAFAEVLGELPHKQTSPVKWPIATIFPFIAFPDTHIFLKPKVTKDAAKRRNFSLNYKPRPNTLTYSCFLEFADVLRDEVADLQPRDMIDIQSYIWVTEHWKRDPSAKTI